METTYRASRATKQRKPIPSALRCSPSTAPIIPSSPAQEPAMETRTPLPTQHHTESTTAKSTEPSSASSLGVSSPAEIPMPDSQLDGSRTEEWTDRHGFLPAFLAARFERLHRRHPYHATLYPPSYITPHNQPSPPSRSLPTPSPACTSSPPRARKPCGTPRRTHASPRMLPQLLMHAGGVSLGMRNPCAVLLTGAEVGAACGF